jgi:hypothetical protein
MAMDSKTLVEAFDLPAMPEEVEDDEDTDVEEADLTADVEMLFDANAEPEARREAFIRAVKAAMKG